MDNINELMFESHRKIKSIELSYIKNKEIYDEIIRIKKYIQVKKFKHEFEESNVARIGRNWHINGDMQIVLITEKDDVILQLIEIEEELQSSLSIEGIDFIKLLHLMLRLDISDIINVWSILKNILQDYNIIIFDDEKGIDTTPLKLSARFSKYIINMSEKKKFVFLNSDNIEDDTSNIFVSHCINFDTNIVSDICKIVTNSVKTENELMLFQIIEEIHDKCLDFNGSSYIFENYIKANDGEVPLNYYIECMTIYNILKNHSFKELQNYSSKSFKESELYIVNQKEAVSFYNEYKNDMVYEQLYVLNVIRATLLKAILLKSTSKKSPENKFHLLVDYINKEIGVLMTREMQLCYSFFNNEKYATDFLNLQVNSKDVIKKVFSMSWDLFHTRLIYNDTIYNGDKFRFDYNSYLTFDAKLRHVIRSIPLKAMIRSNDNSFATIPVFDIQLENYNFKKVTRDEIMNTRQRHDDFKFKLENILNVIESLEREWSELSLNNS